MKTSVLIPVVGCVILGAALAMKSRTASVELSEAAVSYQKLSNDWHQAVFKLDEQSRLSYTLQTGLKILTQEHNAATNELPVLRAGVQVLQSNHVALLESSKVSSNRLRLQVLELEDEREDFRQHLAQASLSVKEVSNSLVVLNLSLERAGGEAVARSNRISQLEAASRNLESRWTDPAFLRAQLQLLGRVDRTETNSTVKEGRLVLQPDGSVRLVTR